MNLRDLILLRDHLWNIRWEDIQHNRSNDGLTNHPAYRTWLGMLNRCYNPKSPAFPLYGGRGIEVCERWLSLSAFIEDMGFIEGLTIDRRDPDLGYSKENCRWATKRQQANNKRIGEKENSKIRHTMLMKSSHTRTAQILPVSCFTCGLR